MKVKLIKTGETANVNDSYGLRLMEQGKAIAAEADRKPEKKAEKKPVGKEAKTGDA